MKIGDHIQFLGTVCSYPLGLGMFEFGWYRTEGESDHRDQSRTVIAATQPISQQR